MDLKVGDFAVSRASLRVSGVIEEVFREEWAPCLKVGGRTLTKLPPTAPGTGRVVCAIRVRRPVNVLEGFDQLPSGFVPVIEDGESPYTDLVYGPADDLQALPDAL
jgi:hypothetical protein